MAIDCQHRASRPALRTRRGAVSILGSGLILLAQLFQARSAPSEPASEKHASPSIAHPPAAGLQLRQLGAATTPAFTRAEFVIDVDQRYLNPYDPDEVRLDLEIQSPTGRSLRLPAFWYQPHLLDRHPSGDRRAEWLYPVGPAEWRARFTPSEPGAYSVVAVLADRGRNVRSEAVNFHCEPQAARGFVRISAADRRFLEFTDGSPYFPLGQNLAFIGETQYLDTQRAQDALRRLAEHGANCARVWACAEDWGLALEARKSAWGRSWDWHPPLQTLSGREGYQQPGLAIRLGKPGPERWSVSPSRRVALRANTEYRIRADTLVEKDTVLTLTHRGTVLGEPVRPGAGASWQPYEHRFTTSTNEWWLGELELMRQGTGSVWIRQLSLQEALGGPELLSEADPNCPVRGHYHQPDAFVLDQLVHASERLGVYLQLCLATRDLYRSDLRDPASPAYQRAVDDARKLLRYAVARWGYSPNVLAWEYFNEMDPSAPTARFYRELGEFLARTDPYQHLRTTSAWGPAPSDWTDPNLDLAQLHWYLRPAWGSLWRDEVAAMLDRTQLIRQHAPDRPAFLAEFGLADDRWGLSPYMSQDPTAYHVRRSLWASAFSGLSGSAWFWWWDTLDPQDAYRHYRPLASFLDGIPWTTAHLRPASFKTASSKARVLAWLGPTQAYAWIASTQATWWQQVVEKAEPPLLTEETFSLADLEPGTYQVEWWDTESGQVRSASTLAVSRAPTALVVPSFTADIAVKIRRPKRS